MFQTRTKRFVKIGKVTWIYSEEYAGWGKLEKVGTSPYIAGTRRAADSKPFRGGKAYMVVSDDPARFWIDWIEAWELR